MQIPLKFDLGLPGWVADTIYTLIIAFGWLVSSAFASLGCMLAFFLLISGFDPVVFVSHIDNLTTRYLEATPNRQHVFDQQVLTVFALLVVLLMVLRAPGIITRIRRELAAGSTHITTGNRRSGSRHPEDGSRASESAFI
jgi:hypothetical protein